jgi:putative flippase GtrA
VSRSARVARFVVVGAAGFVVQLAAVHGLTTAGVHYLVATALAVEAAILHNFVWHVLWTWRDRTTASRGAQFLRFNGWTALASILGNVATAWLLVAGLGVPVVIANAVSVAALAALNFYGADRWIFGAREAVVHAAAMPATRAPVDAGRSAAARRRVAGVLATSVAVQALGTPAQAAELTAETERAWHRYVQTTEKRVERELSASGRFLAIDFDESHARASALRELREGMVLVTNVASQGDDGAGIDIPSGTIHHWRGLVFVPGASVEDLIDAVSDPTGLRAHRQEDVLEARVLARSPNGLRLFLKLQRRAIVTATYNTEHDVAYRSHGTGRASSRSVATRIVEVENVGQPDEYERPRGVDRGFLWGLNSYWRYQRVAGGVVVELESLTLSRAVPWGVGAVVRPLVDRVARESVTRTLAALRARFVASLHPENVSSGILNK